VAALPGDLRWRLEADPALAAGWRWSLAGADLAVAAAPEAVVTLPAAGVVASRDEVACTWRGCGGPCRRPAQRQAAGEAWRAGAALLDAGAGAADAVVEAGLKQVVVS
jgi:hypothetical protein